jgi:AcrR family transcriptional regulator
MTKANGAKRLPPEARRRQLVEVAAQLLSRGGVDALQFTDVAAAAGVTRPIVYKFFPTRGALVEAVLRDFEEALTPRFHEALTHAGSLEEVTQAFIDVICDTIEEKGPGAWQLLDARGPDPEIAEIGRRVQSRLMRPWFRRIGAATGASPKEVVYVTVMLVAAGRAVLERWYAGSSSRKEAARHASRGVSALLEAYAKR